MTPADLSRRVAEILVNWLPVPNLPNWATGFDEPWANKYSLEWREGPPPYASPGEWELFGEMIEWLKARGMRGYIGLDNFIRISDGPGYDNGTSTWTFFENESLNEAAARCVVAIAGEG